uniref:UBC core domain-containing protein n=1 Tax=Myotis myotis TaxID=51298 RepID=A0A7J8AN43_MYOMY|nr:hypothetical protein mMyoMyo1_008146 [Myotis myotis]
MVENSSYYPLGMTLNEKSIQNSVSQWVVDVEGAPGNLYEGETFQLLCKFTSGYRFDSPPIIFTGEDDPVHPHAYSNGHICLSILTEDWSPCSQDGLFVLALLACFPAAKERDDHQVILSMFEHVTRIQKNKQNGGLMIVVDATTIIVPPEKMSTLVIVFEL